MFQLTTKVPAGAGQPEHPYLPSESRRAKPRRRSTIASTDARRFKKRGGPTTSTSDFLFRQPKRKIVFRLTAKASDSEQYR